MNCYQNFESHTLDEHGNLFFCGELPERLRFDERGFETLWHLHPQEYHVIKMHGRPVATARSHAKSRRRAIPTPNISCWSWQSLIPSPGGVHPGTGCGGSAAA